MGSDGAGEKRVYAGQTLKGKAADVALTLKPHRRGWKLKFEVRGAPIRCEGKTQRLDLGVRDVIPKEGRFEAVYAGFPGDGTPDTELFLVRGRVDGDRATGVLLQYFDPYDPPAEGVNRSECWSEGKVPWRARLEASGERSAHPGDRLHHSGDPSTSASAARRPDDGTFQGQALGLPDAGPNDLTLEVIKGGRRVRFDSDFALFCDGPQRSRDFSSITTRIRRDGSFHFSRYLEPRDPRRREFLSVSGRIKGSGASGSFIFIDDPWDPSNRPNQAECGLAPYVDWRVQRGL